MQVESLKVYCDLVDTASFSLAAERNGITQSAVSQQIRSLETRYDVVFFERGKKNFAVTPEGQVFEEAAREIVEIFGGIDERLKELQDVVSGRLRIATIYSVGLHELPSRVAKFRESYPEVKLEIDYVRANQVYLEVLEGRADVGLVAYPKARKGVIVEEFSKDKLVLVCGPDHELAGRKRLKMRDLEGVKFIGFSADLPTRKAIDKLIRDAGVHVDQLLEFDNVETVKRAIEVENGVSLLPQDSVQREVEAGILSSAEVGGAELWRPLGMVKKRTRAVSPAMREFSRMLSGGG
ncbi:MAG: LysR family transcriptional regulator [Verrucomicrobiales bacterium]|nr:LysR family transcriptional regulator [Verrucomicrobiales bacterium]